MASRTSGVARRFATNECLTDNGGCGNADNVLCTNEDKAPPTCTDIDECLTDNGGCGNAAHVLCTNEDKAPPTCTDIDECLTDNGGCGDAAHILCTNENKAPPTCTDIDECLTDNGGCGNADNVLCHSKISLTHMPISRMPHRQRRLWECGAYFMYNEDKAPPMHRYR